MYATPNYAQKTRQIRPDIGVSTGKAATTVSGHKAVVLTSAGILHADPTLSAHNNAVVGISLNAAVSGDPVKYRSFGEIEHSGWTFSPGSDIFIGAAGALTQTVPTGTAFSQRIAYAITATKLRVDIQEPITL